MSVSFFRWGVSISAGPYKLAVSLGWLGLYRASIGGTYQRIAGIGWLKDVAGWKWNFHGLQLRAKPQTTVSIPCGHRPLTDGDAVSTHYRCVLGSGHDGHHRNSGRELVQWNSAGRRTA